MRDKADGSLIEMLIFPNGEKISGINGFDIILQNEYHGEYDIDWAIVRSGNIEQARHNLKYVESVIWRYDK